jgi:hypothetical protein
MLIPSSRLLQLCHASESWHPAYIFFEVVATSAALRALGGMAGFLSGKYNGPDCPHPHNVQTNTVIKPSNNMRLFMRFLFFTNMLNQV